MRLLLIAALALVPVLSRADNKAVSFDTTPAKATDPAGNLNFTQPVNFPINQFATEGVTRNFGNASNKIPIIDGTGKLVLGIIPALPASIVTSGTFADARIASAATWNAKENALTFTGPLSRATNTISMPAATGSVDGYLTATNFGIFNGKLSPTGNGSGLTGLTFTQLGGTATAAQIPATLNATTMPSITFPASTGGTGVFWGSRDGTPPGFSAYATGGTWVLEASTTAVVFAIDGSGNATATGVISAPTLNVGGGDLYYNNTTPVLRLNDATNIVVNPPGSHGTVFLNYDTGTGGVSFGDGSFGVVGNIDNAGNLAMSGNVTGANLFGLNTGDQTIALTGDVTGTGTGTFSATIANSAVTLAKMANVATGTVFYRKTAGTGAPEVQTLATLKTDMGLNNVENTALSTWAGSTNLVTLGTVTAGTWQGTAVGANYVSTTLNSTTMPVLTTSGAGGGVVLTERNGVGANWTLYSFGGYVALYNGTDQFKVDASGNISIATWQGNTIAGTYGGTGVNNGSKTITLGANLATSGTSNTTLAFPSSGTPTYTYPAASQTLASIAGTEALTNKDMSGAGNTWPTFNQNTTGSSAKWTTARLIAGNSVDGSANATFANKFIVQGTADSGLSAAQFTGSLGTGIVKNTTTTGVLSIAVGADFPTLNQNTTGSAATLTTARNIGGVSFNGSADITVATATGGFTVSGGNLALGTNSLTLTGSVGATGARATKVWATDLEITNLPSVNGTALTTTVAKLNFLTSAGGTTGTTSTNIMFSASPTATGTLTADDINLSASVTKSYKINGAKMVAADTVNQDYFFGPAGNTTTTAANLVGIGAGALGNVTSGGYNVAIGVSALASNTTGSDNLALGVFALWKNTDGFYNCAFGSSAAGENTSGTRNTAFSREALATNTKGGSNTAIGFQSLKTFNVTSVTDTYNTGIGALAGFDLTTGTGNTIIGGNTGLGITTGSNNTIIGANVTGLTSSTANTVILADGAGNQRFVATTSAPRLPQLTSNGFVKAGSSNGTLSIDTTTYAVDSGLVHLATTENITGLKNFNAGLNIGPGFNINASGNSVIDVDDNANTVINPVTSGGSVYLNFGRGATFGTVFGDGAANVVGRIDIVGNARMGDHTIGVQHAFAASPNVVFEGDSITQQISCIGTSTPGGGGGACSGGNPNGYNNYMGAAAGSNPDFFSQNSNFTAPAIGTLNGIGVVPSVGQNVAVAGKQAWELLETSYRVNNVYRQEALNVLVYLAGTNDLGLGSLGTSPTYENIAASCKHYRSLGWKVILVGLISRNNSGIVDADINTVNGFLRQNWPQLADDFVDWAVEGNGTNPFINTGGGGSGAGVGYYQSDHLHPSYAGGRKLAQYVVAHINNLLTYYFQPQVGQLFVRSTTASHANDYHLGMFTLQNDNPTGTGQNQINFVTNTSGTYATKENIRGDGSGNLIIGAIGYVGVTVHPSGPDGTDIFAATSGADTGERFRVFTNKSESVKGFNVIANRAGIIGPDTASGINVYYDSSASGGTDYGIMTSAAWGSAGTSITAWKPFLLQAETIKMATHGTDRMFLDNGGGFAFGSTTPDTYSLGGGHQWFSWQANTTNQAASLLVVGNGTGGGYIHGGNATIRRGAIGFENGSTINFYVNTTNSGTGVTSIAEINSHGLNLKAGNDLRASGAVILDPSDNANVQLNPVTNAGAVYLNFGKGNAGFGVIFGDGAGTTVARLSKAGGLTLNGTGDAGAGNLNMTGNITLGGHMGGNGTAPTIARNTGSGSTSTCTVAATSTDSGGLISIAVSGSGIASGQQATITFASAYSAANNPFPVITPVNLSSANIGAYVTYSTSAFSIWFATAPVTGTTYLFTYNVNGR